VKVYCKNGDPVVYPTHLTIDVHDHQPVIIVWQANQTVDEIEDIVFHNPSGEFTRPTRVADRLWMCMDLSSTQSEFKYDIAVKCNGISQIIDPYINNEDGG
jgi:hypothetical protein